MFAGNFAPAGWMFCEGQLIPISENETLFNIIGTTYGGDGQSTFALPDLRGRIPLHQGNGHILSETGGAESVTLTVQQIPAHSHPMLASGNFADKPSPQGNVPAAIGVPNVFPYGTDQPTTPVSPTSVGAIGGSQPHENIMPSLCVDFIISLFGLFPNP
jgi:microcystin-dependent protein